jgi:hypothetical protein
VTENIHFLAVLLSPPSRVTESPLFLLFYTSELKRGAWACLEDLRLLPTLPKHSTCQSNSAHPGTRHLGVGAWSPPLPSSGYSWLAIILFPKAGRGKWTQPAEWPALLTSIHCSSFSQSPTHPWGEGVTYSHFSIKGVRKRPGPCMQSPSLKFYPFKIDIIYLYMI